MSEDAGGGGRVVPWRNPDACSEPQKKIEKEHHGGVWKYVVRQQTRKREQWRDPNPYCDQKFAKKSVMEGPGQIL